MNEGIGRDEIEGRSSERAPDTYAAPPLRPERFGKTAKKINEAKMKLQNAPMKT